jgi:ribosome-associated translation inhibitor RaiA
MSADTSDEHDLGRGPYKGRIHTKSTTNPDSIGSVNVVYEITHQSGNMVLTQDMIMQVPSTRFAQREIKVIVLAVEAVADTPEAALDKAADYLERMAHAIRSRKPQEAPTVPIY